VGKSSSTVTLVIEGTLSPAQAPALSPELQMIIGTPRRVAAYELQAPMRGEAVPEATVEAKDDDLIELRLEGELRLLLSVADYRAQFGDQTSRGPEDKGRLRIRATLPATTRERGILQWVVNGLQVIGIDLTAMAARKLAEHIDSKKGLNGLYSCALSSDGPDLKPAPSMAPGNDPLLVFIHGTMSSTEGSFGGLWTEQRGVLLRLAQQYNDRCYAFEHKTFTKSPISNALDLASVLPVGARLHLVSHSRGGMIGELLCRASRINDAGKPVPPFEDSDFDLFSAENQQASRNDLRQLADVLKKKQLRVERFLRVACPARGTTMASGRLDRYLSVLNMGLSPLIHLDWVKDITWFVAAVAKERTDPAVMPGLEAMMPESATVQLLNRVGVSVDSDLRVIAGDYDGDGILGTVADWAFEGFYGSETDGVVNTPSMYGGAARKGSNQQPLGWFFQAQGPLVYHFSYFKQTPTAALLADGLLQDDARSAGFLPVSQAPHRDDPIARGLAADLFREQFGKPLERNPASAGGSKPILILVPGIMGTHLKVGGKRIWLGFGEIAEGKFSKLGESAAVVDTDGVVRGSYGSIGEFLSSSHEVLYFPYDWRRSLKKEGGEFADYMDQVLETARTNNRPVRILAHSMGGLLVRMAAVLSSAKRDGNGWWERFRSITGNRLVMAGTPNNGSWTVPYVLTGRDPIIGMLATIDLLHDKREILKIVSGFEGFLEMLPPDGADDCFAVATWDKWLKADGGSWPAPDPVPLATSREIQRLLGEFDFDREKEVVRYVAGCADATPSGVRISAGKLVFDSSTLGDGRVLWETGKPAAVKAWYLEAKHGDLLNHEESFKGLSEIIGMGETTLLPDAHPAQRGEGAKAGPMADRMIPYYPDEAMLLQAAQGGELVPPRKRAARRVSKGFRVTVCHGDVAAAKFPAAVGHYLGDSINGTEAVLDRRLSGLLSQRHKLGIYPGPEGTGEVFVLEADKKTFTAIVIGLGQVGDLTPALLTSGFASAVLKFATSPAARHNFSEKTGGYAISTILIGSGAGWGLGVRDSVRALIEGARRANNLLAELGGESICLAELEFLEVFEDRALQALRAVRGFAALGLLGNIDYDTALRVGAGGRYRAMVEENDDWWQRIKVEVNDEDVMKFTTLTGLARIEEAVLPTQRALVDRLVELSVTQSTVSEDAMVAIYNLVTPNALKERAPDQGDLLIMLDQKAARYPWEMMHISVGGRRIPLALRSGLIRQLSVKEFRHRPVRSYQPRALVIADPLLPKNGELPSLPGAYQEGVAVASTLEKRGYRVNSQIGKEPLQIVSALFADDYRILHLAGHGIYEYPVTRKLSECREKTSYVTGMVLDWPGKGAGKEPAFLTAVEVDQMAVVPELVFINCCFLGKIEGKAALPASENRNLFASSLAERFISMGVRAVVAAGWAVDDAAAKAFAAKFYSTLLDGSPFGEAVMVARNAAKDAAPRHNTWAAYQCYGDPAYRLKGDNGKAADKFFLSPREAICELRAIRDRRRDDAGNLLDKAALLKELQRAESLISHQWMMEYGEIRAVLGEAYAEIGEFDRAIEQYQAAVRSPDGCCTLKDLDQLANVKARRAEKKVKNGQMLEEDAKREINAVIAQLEARSLECGETGERSSITASAYKRLLMLGAHNKEETDRILGGMARWYEKAARFEGDLDPYPAMNWICIRILQQSREKTCDPAEIARLRESLNKAAQAGKKLNEQDPQFWHGVYEIDASLYLILLDRIDGDTDRAAAARLKKLYEGYLKLADDFGSSRKMDSVAAQVRFIARYLPKSMQKMKEELEELEKELAG
jgi:pimeloyl-ACP methyl ester carboxylesterase/tetratricopeptide (TPR) repeat protein